jgi:hypothetical protein
MKKYNELLYKKQDFITSYIRNNLGSTSIVDSRFVDSYIKEFNPKHIVQPFGANSCKEIGKMLSYFYKCNILDRTTVSLYHIEPGFPKWVYVYFIKEIK